MRFFIAVIIIMSLPGCAWWRGVRGLPPVEKAPEELVTKVNVQESPPVENTVRDNETQEPKPLKVDPGFKGVGDKRGDDQFNELMARKKKDVFSLRGEDRPIRSIQGDNDVESRELRKIYDDLDQGRKSGSSVFKFME